MTSIPIKRYNVENTKKGTPMKINTCNITNASDHARSMLVLWRNRTSELARMHNMARVYYMRISAWLTLTSIVFSVISSSSAVFGGVSNGSNDILGILIGVFGVISTLLISINAFLAPGKIQQEHEDCHRKYVRLARDITVHMHLDRVGTDQMFINIHQCMRYMQIYIDDLEDMSPPIPVYISELDAYNNNCDVIYRFSSDVRPVTPSISNSQTSSCAINIKDISISHEPELINSFKNALRHARSTLELWRQRAVAMARMHDSARALYMCISTSLMVTSISFSVAASSSAVFSGADKAAGPFDIAIGVVGVVSTLLISINAFVAPGNIQQEHEDCHRKYVKISRDITVHLHLDNVGTDQMFKNIHQCMRYMQIILDDIEDRAPPFPRHIYYIDPTIKDIKNSDGDVLSTVSSPNSITSVFKGHYKSSKMFELVTFDPSYIDNADEIEDDNHISKNLVTDTVTVKVEDT